MGLRIKKKMKGRLSVMSGYPYHLTTLRAGNEIAVIQVFMDGSRMEIARFLLPNDGQWRADVDFLDSIMDAYKARLKRHEKLKGDF